MNQTPLPETAPDVEEHEQPTITGEHDVEPDLDIEQENPDLELPEDDEEIELESVDDVDLPDTTDEDDEAVLDEEEN